MDDLISRQLVLKTLCEKRCGDKPKGCPAGFCTVSLEVDCIPSAQPEIIHCKECKWYGRADKRRFYRGMDCLQKRIDTIIPDKDFCSRAERREE